MAYLLVALTIYQFAFRTIGLHGSALYLVLNPYFLALPFIIFWIGSAIIGKERTDRNLLIGWLVIFLFPCVMLRNATGDIAFALLFIRGLQFFWGPALLIPAFLGFFRMAGYLQASDIPIQTYIKWMAAIFGTLTLFELLAVHVLRIPPLTFPWIGIQGSTSTSVQDINPFRPWGIPSYPQPNALMMAYLFWLSTVWGAHGVYHKLVTFCGVLLSGSGTGQMGLAAMAGLVVRRPLTIICIILVPVAAIVTYATATEQYYSGTAVGRLDLAYLQRLYDLFYVVTERFLGRFSQVEFLMGSNNPTQQIVTGYTHDWAYLDVFLAYGATGMVGYSCLFGAILYLCLPPSVPAGRRLFFALLGLGLNFHYGTLNFYAGQLILSSIVAMRLNQAYTREHYRINAIANPRPAAGLSSAP